jgi:hypothetical protein
MKKLINIVPVVLLYMILLAVSCKNDKSDYKQKDTEEMRSTDQSDPPTAYKDTIVTSADSLNEPLPEENAKSQGEQVP